MPDYPQTLYVRNGLTIRQLKALLATYPDVNAFDGEEREVWITTDEGLSSMCVEAGTLNMRTDNGVTSADLLLTPSNYI
jgi:hypothetical protein